MQELFVRTLSQGLQAFMPIAAFLACARSLRQTQMIASTRWAMAAAVLLTVPAGYLFQNATHQAGIEASLATAALAATMWFGSSVHANALRAPLAVAAATLTLILLRQTMEIEVVLRAALVELRSLEASIAVSSAVFVSLLLAVAWTVIARWLSAESVRRASIAFTAVFLLQCAVYAFHESAEARVLPWSEVLHTASEPYGPEGEYGRPASYLLFLIPVMSVVAGQMRDGLARLSLFGRRRVATIALAGFVCVVAITASIGSARLAREVAPAPASPTLAASITA